MKELEPEEKSTANRMILHGLNSASKVLSTIVLLGGAYINPKSLEAQSIVNVPYVIKDGASFNGLDLSPDSEQLVVASGSLHGGQLVVVSTHEMEVSKNIDLPHGVMPADPKYSVDGSQLIYSGLCLEQVTICAGVKKGWNIFLYDFADKETRQITNPHEGFVRRDPIWGPNNRKYFVGFSEKWGGSRTTAANAIFEIFEGGETRPIFPKDSLSPKTETIFNYLAKATSLSIVSVRGDSIVFKARIATKQIRPSDELMSRFEKSSGVEFDPRLTQFVDRKIYPISRETLLSRETANTLFNLSEDKLEIFHEMVQVSGELPTRLSVYAVAAERAKLWLWASTLDESFQGKIIEFDEFTSKMITPPDAETSGNIVAFDVAKDKAVMAFRKNDESVLLYVFSDWKSLDIFRIRPEKR